MNVHRLRSRARDRWALAVLRPFVRMVRGKTAPGHSWPTDGGSGQQVGTHEAGADGLGGVWTFGEGFAVDGGRRFDALGAAWRARAADPEEIPLSPQEAMYLLPAYRAMRGVE